MAGNPPQTVWTSKVPVDDGDYYIYGFMPSSELSRVSMAPLNGDYSNGAVMTISGLPALTPTDPSVIVAIKGSGQYVKLHETLAKSGCKCIAYIEGNSYEVSVQSSKHKQMSNSPETVNKYFITEREGLKWFEEMGY
jgi:hypothetical protein